MFTRLAKVFVQGMFLVLLPLATFDSGARELMVSPPGEEAAKEYAVIPDQVFAVRGSGGSLSHARLVLEDGWKLLSCFTDPPESITALQGPGASIVVLEENYACFDGREPLERLARDKQLARPWSMRPRQPSPFAPKYRGIDGEETDDWGQGELEYRFWDSYGAGGGGRGARCISECSTALSAALRFCAALPPPGNELCALGAAGLYVACIASC